MDKCREAFEEWFKTTAAYKLLEDQNYFKIDLFTFIEARNKYNHTAVQISFMTWQEQQKRIDELERSLDARCKQLIDANDHYDYQKKIADQLQARVDEITQLHATEQFNKRVVAKRASEKMAELQRQKDEVQARVDAALKDTQHALRYVEEDMRGNHEFLQMDMIRTFNSLAQTLKGGES